MSDDGRRLALSDELRLVAGAIAAVQAGHHLPVTVGRSDTPAASRAAVRDMAFSAVRRLGLIRALIEKLNRRAPQPEVFALQAASLSELLDGRRAAAIVVDQAVRAARASRKTRAAAGLINAVLRRFERERADLVGLCEQDPVARLNFPRWWIDRVAAEHPEHYMAMLALANEPPPMTLRVNVRRSTVSQARQTLAAAGHDSDALGGEALRLAIAAPVERLPGFAQGHLSVQDAGAQLASRLLPCEAGQRVLDACAAPGGKSAALLERHALRLSCLDLDESRLDRVRADMQRLGLTPERILAGDAADPATWWDGEPYDAILADVPCSASGIVRRHPEIRWLRRRRDLATFATQQAQILTGLWPTLKPGGKLLYATCSVFVAEGQDTIDAFLRQQPAARRVPLTARLAGVCEPVDQLLPTATRSREHDGFFYALIEKLR